MFTRVYKLDNVVSNPRFSGNGIINMFFVSFEASFFYFKYYRYYAQKFFRKNKESIILQLLAVIIVL